MPPLSYSGYRFPRDIIQRAVWMYLRFTLSFRDVEELLAERGIVVTTRVSGASLFGRSRSSAFWLSYTMLRLSRGLSLLSGIGAIGPSTMGSEERSGTIWAASSGSHAASGTSAGYGLTSFIVPRETGFRSGADQVVLLTVMLVMPRLGQVACASRVQRKSVPSVQMRCKTTARRRASAITALRPPRRRATFIAQAFSHDHLITRVSID